MGQDEHIADSVPKLDKTLHPRERQIWETVFRTPLKSFWSLKDIPYGRVARRVWRGLFEDRVFGWAAELGFYFLFALFPTLICASSILGLVARSAHQFYAQLLGHLAIVIPTSAMGAVLKTFNETTTAATSGKVTFGLIAAIWSASVGVSAVQETLNAVYNIEDRRSYLVARLQAIGLTILLIVMVSLGLGSMLAGDFFAHLIDQQVHDAVLHVAGILAVRLVSWIVAGILLALTFAVLYYFAPDCNMRWHWITPGAVIGIVGWMLASLGFRLYLHYFNTYSVTYGSLGAVVILLMWFYISGLMLLVGAEVNSQIEAVAAEKTLEQQGTARPVAGGRTRLRVSAAENRRASRSRTISSTAGFGGFASDRRDAIESKVLGRGSKRRRSKRRLTMEVEFTARQVSVPKGIRSQAEEGLERIARILGRGARASVVFRAQRHLQIAELTIKARVQTIEAAGKADTLESALRIAIQHAENQALRYRDKQFERKRMPKLDKEMAAPPVAPAKRGAQPEGVHENGKLTKAKVKTAIPVHSFPASTTFVEPHIMSSGEAIAVKPMTIEEAVKDAEFRDRDLLIFRNRAGDLYVLHRRRDGQMELVEIP